MDEWLRALRIPGHVRQALRKTSRCECGKPRTHLALFQVLTGVDSVVTQAMWLCEEHAGQVDWGVQILEIPKGDEMKQSIRTRIEAAELDDMTYATARRLLQYANAQGVLRLGLWTLAQICGEEPDDLRRQLDALATNGIAVWVDGDPILLRFQMEKATPAGSGPAGA